MCKCVLPPGDNTIAVNKYIISFCIYCQGRSQEYKKKKIIQLQNRLEILNQAKLLCKACNVHNTYIRKNIIVGFKMCNYKLSTFWIILVVYWL